MGIQSYNQYKELRDNTGDMSQLINDGFGSLVNFGIITVVIIATMFLIQGIHHTAVTPKFMQNRALTLSYIYVGWALIIMSVITYIYIKPDSSGHAETIQNIKALEASVYEEIALDYLKTYNFKGDEYLRLKDTTLPLGHHELSISTKEGYLHYSDVIIITSTDIKENVVVPFNSELYSRIKQDGYIELSNIEYIINLVDHTKGIDEQ